MIFGKNARTNNDIIQSKYDSSYVGEYVIKKNSVPWLNVFIQCYKRIKENIVKKVRKTI